MADLVAGDETDLTLTLVGRDRERINLLGGSCNLRWRIDGGALTVSGMTLVTPTQGVVRYRFQTGELARGRLTADVQATTSAGQTFTSRKVLSFEVRELV